MRIDPSPLLSIQAHRTLHRRQKFIARTSVHLPLHRQRLKQLIHLAPAVGERVEPDAHLVEQRQVQVGQRRRLGEADVAAASHSARGAAGDEDRQVVVVVQVGVAHAAAVQEERMVQQRAVAFRRGPQLGEELGEQRRRGSD